MRDDFCNVHPTLHVFFTNSTPILPLNQRTPVVYDMWPGFLTKWGTIWKKKHGFKAFWYYSMV